MPLTSTSEILKKAQANKYAVGAFNVENMEMLQAVVAAAVWAESPIIIQTTPKTVRYAEPLVFRSMAAAVATEAPVPVAIHLDHGEDFSTVMMAIRAGYTSVMMDGSKESLPENIRLTKTVVSVCKPINVPVEGELGKVGGKEDDAGSADSSGGYTDPGEAQFFVKETGVSSLAVGVGTAHGVYAIEPKLNIPLISELRHKLSIPLVLHGASGLADEVIIQCIAAGISKVNFATELRIAFTQETRKILEADKNVIDPKKFGSAARTAVKNLVINRLNLLGSVGRA
ncbi:MAG: class II fructose-bisphosphate aldolase family protein [Deltaproteobacteria bacterium]|jgi:tagatose 1,6-diphosphate aldolase GatY/KbaY|nr:class II fructose-bisphosphate aldolase family protein [Deltaproteobacteria bacterium]